MKRSAIIWLIIAVILIIAGAVLFTAVMSARNWDFASLDNSEPYKKTVFEIGEPFENIDIQGHTEDIMLLPSQDGAVRVEICEPENCIPKCAVKDGTLTVEIEDARKPLDHIGFSFGTQQPAVTVYLPQGEYGTLKIAEHTGMIVVRDFTFDRIGISDTTGDVYCYASSKGVLKIGTDTGDIALAHLSAGSAELSVTSGRVSADTVSCTGDLNVTVTTGKTTLKDVNCGSFTTSGDTGSVRMENLIAAGKILIRRTTGDIRFDRCDASELSVRTDTGDVKGTLLTDKIFVAGTDTGDISVPGSVNGGKCEIVTDTGDIEMRIGG